MFFESGQKYKNGWFSKELKQGRDTWPAPVGQGVIGPGRSHGPGPMTRSGPGPMALATGPRPMAQAAHPGGGIGPGWVWARDKWAAPLRCFLLVYPLDVEKFPPQFIIILHPHHLT